MGIDIYLNGYDAYQERSRPAREAFDYAVEVRDAFERESEEHKEAQKEVERTGDEMWSASYGYLRSSYNHLGMFNVLEEIMGADVAGMLFPGDWEEDVPLDMERYKKILFALMEAAKSLEQGTFLPILDKFREAYGEPIPDPHPNRVGSEAFGAQVRELLTVLAGKDGKVEPAPQKPKPTFDMETHGRGFSYAMLELAKFGDCARNLKEETGKDVFVYISF